MIYHTHELCFGKEFSDSKKTILTIPLSALVQNLQRTGKKRGYSVYHDTTRYDSINGGIDRSLAYNKSLERVQNIYEKKIRVLKC